MLETSARLLQLLGLFQGRRYWAGGELADRLEVTPRTLRRDVDKLRSLGYPIHSSAGVDGGYSLGAGRSMPPLLLDDEEAVAVALGLRAAATGAIAGAEEAAVRALAKVEQILPPRLRRRAEALQAMVVTAPLRGTPADAAVLAAIAGACRDLETLCFKYESHGGAASTRTVEPHRVVHTGSRWYLVAWDTDRAAWRTFRLDRLRSRPALGARFTPRPAPAADLAAYVTKGAWLAPPCRARVTLHLDAATAAERLHPCAASLVEPVDERSCRLEMGGATWESLAMHLAWLGVDFDVREPVELVTAVQIVAARYSRATNAGSPFPG